ncbi:GNAT family protein [uncultured Paraglaciecola sp.]|uniref:GNAT family N-acetyltransferase n=1 Tax=uncultured Paraglaciecola sp. TaxID=1765024 RepID=UPI0030D81FD6|tara:strand:+ start:43387 stop:43959 length:573 start_codon:yes stop_codon:yes gene_type:complete
MNIEENSHLLPKQLTGRNIYLRIAKMSDFEAIKSYRQDPENCRYIRPPENDDETLRIVDGLCKSWRFTEGQWNGFVICLTGSDTAIGEIVFRVEDWHNQRAEIGYRISQTAAGRGVCTEALTLLVDLLFTDLGFFKLVAKCDPRNTGSYRVMEKLGFKREAFFKEHYLLGDEWTDQYDYGLLASEWKKPS